MTFVKHRQKRVNLEAVAGYKAKNKVLIEFVYHGEPIEWRFASKAERDKALEKLDEIVDSKELSLKKNYAGTVEAKVI